MIRSQDMNKAQRERLNEALGILEEVKAEEEDKYENAPENLIGTEKVEKLQENAEVLQVAIDSIVEAAEV